MQLIGALLLLFALPFIGCTSHELVAEKPASDPQVQKVVQPTEEALSSQPTILDLSDLDGSWKQVGVSCRTGEPSFEAVNQFKSGQSLILIRIHGTTADVDAKMFEDVRNKTRYCRWIAQETWQILPENHLKVSGLKVNKHGYGGAACSGTWQLSGERLYDFELKGATLRLSTPRPVATPLEDPKRDHYGCLLGESILIFERVL